MNFAGVVFQAPGTAKTQSNLARSARRFHRGRLLHSPKKEGLLSNRENHRSNSKQIVVILNRLSEAATPLFEGDSIMLRRSGMHAVVSLAVSITAGLIGLFPRNAVMAQAVATAPEIETQAEGLASANANRENWLKAALEERVKIAEEIGEDGARRYAREQGYTTVFDGKVRSVRQGPDQVYFDPRTGETVVVEAKGGTSPLGKGYGYEQGTKGWAVKSAEQILHNPSTLPAERAAAERIIEAARNGKLRVEVVRTPHTLGQPGTPILERAAMVDDAEEAARLAEEISKRFRLRPTAAPQTPKSGSNGSGVTAAAKVLERGSRAAEEGEQVLRQASRAGRAASAAEEGAATAAKAAAGAGNLSKAATLSKAAKVAGPIAMGVDVATRLYRVDQVEQAYARGEITEHERTLEHAKNVAGCAGGWAGAWAGAEVGGASGAAIGTAICPGIGTAIGGFVGYVGGAIGGYYAGEALAEQGTEAIMKK